eukprot:6202689-Pleurochrysis_carterae.AAC.2
MTQTLLVSYCRWRAVGCRMHLDKKGTGEFANAERVSECVGLYSESSNTFSTACKWICAAVRAAINTTKEKKAREEGRCSCLIYATNLSCRHMLRQGQVQAKLCSPMRRRTKTNTWPAALAPTPFGTRSTSLWTPRSRLDTFAA